MRRRTEFWFRNFMGFWALLPIAVVGMLTGASWPVLLLPLPLLAAMFLWPAPTGWQEELPRVASLYRRCRGDDAPDTGNPVEQRRRGSE